MSLRLVASLAAALLWVAGCGSDTNSPTVIVSGPDSDAGPDAGEGGGDVGEGEGEGEGGAPVTVQGDPVVVEKAPWIQAAVRNGDPVGPALEDGSFTWPGPGVDSRGVEWREVTPGEDINFGRFGAVVYVATRIDLPADMGLVARVDHVDEIFTNGVRQPGDPYGSGRIRVPLVTQPGDNVVVFRAAQTRGDVRVDIVGVRERLWMNDADRTFQDPRVGDASEGWIGLPVLNTAADPVYDVRAVVVGGGAWEETSVTYPSLGGGAATQVGWRLRPVGPFPELPEVPEGEEAEPTLVPVVLRLESADLAEPIEHTVELQVVPADAPFRASFRSPVDHSVQYYGVQAPSDFDPEREYGLVLSLHGAGVDAIGQARSYSKHDWAYVVAPTNRRPFGFDWEEWGRLNALRALDDAMARFHIDPTRVYVSGHSMGGHGTWHVGVSTPGRFATLGPSAGWGSFYSYTGMARPGGFFARARAHSETKDYIDNLAHRGVYVIHGSADDNVPVREGREMSAAAREVTDDVEYHEEPGAGHWWDGDESPGADCVDWPPLFDFMQAHTLDPLETEFTFRTESPSYSAEHSYVTLESAASPLEDCEVASTRDGDTVTLTTTNVRSLSLDGAGLASIGVATVVVDGEPHDVTGEAMPVGPRDGKRPGVHGPWNEVLRKPHCYVYGDGAPEFRDYAAWLTTQWQILGNGHACVMPLAHLTDDLRDRYNIVYVGVAAEEFGSPPVPFGWDDGDLRYRQRFFDSAAVMFVFPERDALSGAYATKAGSEDLLFGIHTFNSRAGMPDFFVWGPSGGLAAGFFDEQWYFDPSLATP